MRAFSQTKVFPRILVSFVLFAAALAGASVHAQTPQQLSLADLLIGLRSKKATLPERNQILAGAVVERGITFSLTPEIEKELTNTGADNGLIQAIKVKSPVAAVVPSKIEIKPVATPAPPPPPDANFYKKRADSYVAKGEFDLAVVDLNRIFDMKSEDASVYISRAAAYAGRNRHDLAIGDLDKAIQLDPKQAVAWFSRGESYEKLGNKQKAIEDYQKAVDLDAANEPAKSSLQRLQAETTARVEPKPADPKPSTPEAAPPPVTSSNTADAVNLGQIAGPGVKLVTPVYPATARQLRIQGKVTVQVNLDEEGKVVSAKATNGPVSLRAVSEEAVRRSKFNPAKIGDRAVKSTGYVIYNFVN